jgi:hypothetical protein
VLWSDLALPGGGWYLNSRRVHVPPVLRARRVRRDEVRHRRFILSLDLLDNPAFSLNLYNWITFGAWEFDPRRRAG